MDIDLLKEIGTDIDLLKETQMDIDLLRETQKGIARALDSGWLNGTSPVY